jgi:putative Holliday junction resolvase
VDSKQGASSSSTAVSSIIALDVGSVRVGVAVARTDIRMAHPLTTLSHDDQLLERIQALVREHNAARIVVGWPRGLEGQSTAQTKSSEAFAERVAAATGLPVTLQDEALTSVMAEAELKNRQRHGQQGYQKGEVDALAATYILEDYLGV